MNYSLTEHGIAFLGQYAKYMEWRTSDPAKIVRRLVEQQYVNPRNREWVLIAYGYIWGMTQDQAVATVEAGMLEGYVHEVYQQVAKENHWDDEEDRSVEEGQG